MSGFEASFVEMAGDLGKFATIIGLVSAWFSRLTLELIRDFYYEIRAHRRVARLRRVKLLKAAKAYASGRTDLGTATGFDPRFLDAINQLEARNRREAWEAQQAAAGR